MSDLFLGIDTSNYKTSVAVTDASGSPVFERSEYLPVPQGKRGLRQSECFFRHSCILPEFIDDVCSEISISDIKAAGVSSRPRRVEGSYMPCFLAGVNAAREISSVLGIPLHEFSHQEGHAAAVISCGTPAVEDPGQEETALMHLSGGTTEFLRCRSDASGYDLEIIGGTRDISIGQLIDRAGVAMGFSFPSGMYLDKLAEEYVSSSRDQGRSAISPVRTDAGSFNLSGTETQVLRWIDRSSPDEYPFIAYSLFDRVARLLAVSVSEICAGTGIRTVYMAGGVSASAFIRRRISEEIDRISAHNKSLTADIRFSSPALSGDNAVGIALLAGRLYMQR